MCTQYIVIRCVNFYIFKLQNVQNVNIFVLLNMTDNLNICLIVCFLLRTYLHLGLNRLEVKAILLPNTIQHLMNTA